MTKQKTKSSTAPHPNSPQLRFPEFEGAWEKRKLGEIGDVRMCKRIFNEETQPTGEIPFFKIGSFGREPDAYITRELYENYKTKFAYPKKGEILISAAGTIGRTVVYDGQEAYFQDSNIVWIDNSCKIITNEFLYYILQLVKFNTEGGTIQRLYNNILKSTVFYNPTVPEQTKIATFLTAVDEKIQALKKKKTLLESYKKGVMQQLFPSTHTGPNPRLRFKIPNDKGDLVTGPDWEVRKLGEVTYKTDKKNKDKESLPVYSISNVNGFVPQSEQFEGMDSVERGYDTSLYKIIEDNTFAYNPARINVGSIGYSGEIGRVLVSSLYVCFKTIDIIDDSFFNHYLYTPHFKDSVLRNGEGGVRIYLFYENFSEITINIPTLPEQTRIAQFLSSLDEKINQVQGQIEKTEAWKKGVVQRMFM